METITTNNLLVKGELIERQDEILTEGALSFIENLEVKFGDINKSGTKKVKDDK